MNHIARIIIAVGALTIAACATQSQQGSPAASNNSAGVPKGYYHKVVEGQDLYCHNDTDTGSRVQRSEVCLTRDQLAEQEQANRDATHQTRGTVIH